MRTISLWKNTLVVAILLAVLFPMLGKAGPMGKAGPLVGKNCLSVTNRPLSDFLNTQGTLNNPPQFFPPVKDYVGWADGDLITFALVDYAGLRTSTSRLKRDILLAQGNGPCHRNVSLADGKAQITVALLTTRALGFAQSIEDLATITLTFSTHPTDLRRQGQRRG